MLPKSGTYTKKKGVKGLDFTPVDKKRIEKLDTEIHDSDGSERAPTVKAIDRKKERHGYNPGGDEEAYEDMNEELTEEELQELEEARQKAGTALKQYKDLIKKHGLVKLTRNMSNNAKRLTDPEYEPDADMRKMFKRDARAAGHIARHLQKGDIRNARRVYHRQDTAAKDDYFEGEHLDASNRYKDYTKKDKALARVLGVQLSRYEEDVELDTSKENINDTDYLDNDILNEENVIQFMEDVYNVLDKDDKKQWDNLMAEGEVEKVFELILNLDEKYDFEYEEGVEEKKESRIPLKSIRPDLLMGDDE